MEGVGARLGRSSARYAPTTVFSGPVRRWKKKWVPLSNPNNSNSNNNNHSHLLLFKWTPIASSKDAASADATPPSASEEAPRRKFRYIPWLVADIGGSVANGGWLTGSWRWWSAVVTGGGR
ncbi:hypothetical protein MA16_Dca026107 [Dendrobium catenatum]|uniref:Uncharacterized protein n=1 Tax=Dendrobium catenatum TaxID=906689 RepID=A0A2I0VAD2_9ASPA|nr:hypothetical protein MA16_Dca026107 [Dendrobium catenatum]